MSLSVGTQTEKGKIYKRTHTNARAAGFSRVARQIQNVLIYLGTNAYIASLYIETFLTDVVLIYIIIIVIWKVHVATRLVL